MGKKIAMIGVIISVVLAMGMLVHAATNATVTFTDDEKLVLSDTSLGNVFEGMAPGDKRTLTIEVINEDIHTTDFYMSAEALQSLEDVNKSSGGAYNIVLTVDDNAIYSNSDIGGASSLGTSTSKGLYDVEELKDKLFVATLSQGQRAVVRFTMGLDGEAFTNSDDNSYANALGEFNFEFQAAYDEDKGLTVVDREVVTREANKVVYVTGTVATGDDTNVWPLVMALGIGVLLVVGAIVTIFKKKKSSIALGLVLLLCLLPVTNIYAAEVNTPVEEGSMSEGRQYTVSFMSGASGVFEDGSTIHNVLVPANGTALIEDYMLEEVTPKEGYYIKGGSWSVQVGDPITKSTQYILSYGKLSSNAVPYRIEYVDADSGDQIANSTIRYANPGESITFPGIKFIENYAFVSASPVDGMILSENSDNVIQLAYEYTAGRTVENIINTVVAGGVTTITVNPVVPIPNPPVPQANVPVEPAAPGETIEDEQTPEGETPTGEDEENPEEGLTDDQDTTTIEDEETPEGPIPSNQTADQQGNSTAILASILGIIAVILIAAYIVVAQKKKTNDLHHKDK